MFIPSQAQRIMLSVVSRPMPYAEILNARRSRHDNPFAVAMALTELVLEGLLQRWETCHSYIESAPAYAPAGMKKPRGFKQPVRSKP